MDPDTTPITYSDLPPLGGEVTGRSPIFAAISMPGMGRFQRRRFSRSAHWSPARSIHHAASIQDGKDRTYRDDLQHQVRAREVVRVLPVTYFSPQT